MGPAELQLTHQVVGFVALIAEPSTTPQAVGADQRYLAHGAVADSLNQRLAGRGVTALDPGEDIDALPLGLLARAEQSMQTARIGGEWFLHKHIDALADGVLHVQRPDVRARRAHGYIAGPEDVDGSAVGVEATELAVLGDVDFVGKPFPQRLERPFHLLLDEIGRGIQLDRPAVRNRQGVTNGAGAAPAAANQRQADSVVFTGESDRSDTAEHGRACGERTTLFEKLSTVDIGLVDRFSHVCLLGL